MQIRPLDPASSHEIELVAARMKQTLVEVLGEEEGTALYSMEWLVQRVRWHLDPLQTTATIYLAEAADGHIAAHAIARIEHEGDGERYGYFSTVFVEPASRNKGVARALIARVESWLRSMNMPRVVYNTAGHHAPMIRLLERHGFRITHRAAEMVQLTKLL
jgi:GNAT superfamily N-acetyltransferase